MMLLLRLLFEFNRWCVLMIGEIWRKLIVVISCSLWWWWHVYIDVPNTGCCAVECGCKVVAADEHDEDEVAMATLGS